MISIIIPTYNNSRYLDIALKSVLKQSYNNDYEIIVVDNGSTDDTREVVESLSKNNKYKKVRYFYDEVPGQLTGRHRGFKESNGDILVFIDDDIIADKDWLKSIYEAFKDPSVMLVGGKGLPKYEIEPPAWLEWFWYRKGSINRCGSLSLSDLGSETREIDTLVISGLNFSIRKAALIDLGGFHPDVIPKKYQHFQGDGETGLGRKATERGYKAIYQPRALVYHQVPKSRMTYEYFDKRFYYQGVCDSYTDLRRKYGKYKPKKKTIKSIIPEPIKRPMRFVKSIISKPSFHYAFKQYPEERKLKERFKKAYHRGYDFHQKAVKNSPELLKWVLRDNYWDYKLLDIKCNYDK